MTKQRGKLLQAFCVVMCSIILFGCSKQEDPANQIYEYAKTHDVFCFSDVLDFKWDVAYNDIQTYGTGKYIQEKYHVDIELQERFESEHLRRLFFFLEGEMVKVVEYDWIYKVHIPTEIEVIFPNTMFSAAWLVRDESKDILRLEPVPSA